MLLKCSELKNLIILPITFDVNYFYSQKTQRYYCLKFWIYAMSTQ